MAVDFATTLFIPDPIVLEPVDLINPGRSSGFLRRGAGSFAGTSPDGLTTVGGTPTSATVVVRARHPNRSIDGWSIQSVESSPSGTWSLGRLNTDLRYDVVGRLEDENDVIVSGVTPI